MEKMRFCALTTGSSGNCYYIENSKDALIIDAGISAKRINELALGAGVDISKVKGILLTHEHSDHIKGADVLSRQLNVPVFSTQGTFDKMILSGKAEEINNDEEFNIGSFKIRAVSKNHSAADPVSFIVTNGKKKVSFMTDLGKVCKESSEAINESDFIFLESNHDIKMLENGPYLPFHKKWVLSDKGHLSNLQASLAILEYAKQNLGGIGLAHLSRVNNTPELAKRTFDNILKERYDFTPKIFVSEKNIPTKIFEI